LNNNHHKPQNLQIVWQYFSSVLLLTLFVINYQFVAAMTEDKLIDISAVNTDLGVFENNPTIKEISSRIKELNPHLKNSQMTKNCNIEIKETTKPLESKGKVIITAKEESKTIKGKIELFFDIKQDLNDLIENKYLGEFELKKINTKAPEIEDLKTVILTLNPNLVLEQIEFVDKNLESEKLIIKAKSTSLKYKGKTQFTYKIKKIDKKTMGHEIVKEIVQDAQEQKNITSLETLEKKRKKRIQKFRKKSFFCG